MGTTRTWDPDLQRYVTVDSLTGEPVATDTMRAYSGGGPAADDPFLGAYSYDDLKRSEMQGAKRAAIAGGVGALGTLAQGAALAMPNAADTENQKRIREIRQTPGLTKGRRAEIDEQAMRGVRAIAGERMARTGDALASTGNTSAAALQRARASEADAMNRASIQAADIGIEAEQAERARKAQELQERIAYKAQRQNEKIGFAAQAAGSLIQALAKPIAAGVVSRGPTDQELLDMQALKNASGAPMYPGLQGKTTKEMRALAFDQWRASPTSTGSLTP